MKKKIFLDGPRAPRSTILKKTVGALGTRMPGIRAGVFIWEEFKKFPARLTRSRSQKPRSRLPGQPAFSYEHIEIFVKKRAARRDLGNRASLVNRAHMKRPLVVQVPWEFTADRPSEFNTFTCFIAFTRKRTR